MHDGQWINERVVIRDGHPMLTNNLSKVPENDLKKLSFKEILESRIIQCKYKVFARFLSYIPKNSYILLDFMSKENFFTFVKL